MVALREYRQRAGMSGRQAAQAIGVVTRSLYDYENGVTPVPPDVTLRAVEVFGTPEAIQDHCRACSIGQRYGFVRLNNIDTHPLAVARSMREETAEAIEALEAIERIQSRRGPLSELLEGQAQQAERAADEIIDVLHNGWIALEALARDMGVDLADAFHRHNTKCCIKGYAVQTKTPAATGA